MYKGTTILHGAGKETLVGEDELELVAGEDMLC
jgi:hypothetical protein